MTLASQKSSMHNPWVLVERFVGKYRDREGEREFQRRGSGARLNGINEFFKMGIWLDFARKSIFFRGIWKKGLSMEMGLEVGYVGFKCSRFKHED